MRALRKSRGGQYGVVHTSDSFQGRDERCVIIDLVMTKYIGEDTLGHVGDVKKANVAFTRARDFLFVVGDSIIFDSRYLDKGRGGLDFVFDFMVVMLARNAIKRCHTTKLRRPNLAERLTELGITGLRPLILSWNKTDEEGADKKA